MTKRQLVEDCRILDIAVLKRRGLVHGTRSTGKITWRNEFLVSYEHDGKLSLTLTYPDGHRQRLMLYRMPMPLGGHRWMFRPAVDRFAFKLYMPKDGNEFRSRAAWGLEYRCRSVGSRKRRAARVDKMLLRYGFGLETIKPVGMWSRTWERKKAQLAAIKSRGAVSPGVGSST